VEAVQAFERITDEILAIIVVVAAITMLAVGVKIPEWFYVAFGMIIAFYFRGTAEAHRAGGGS